MAETHQQQVDEPLQPPVHLETPVTAVNTGIQGKYKKQWNMYIIALPCSYNYTYEV